MFEDLDVVYVYVCECSSHRAKLVVFTSETWAAFQHSD